MAISFVSNQQKLTKLFSIKRTSFYCKRERLMQEKKTRQEFDEKLYRKNLVNYLFIARWMFGCSRLILFVSLNVRVCMQMFTHGVKKVVLPKAKKKEIWDIFTD